MPIDILEELRRRHVAEPGPDAPVYITDSLTKRPIGAGGSFTDPVEEFLGPESRAFGALEAATALTSGMAAMAAGGIRGIGAALMGEPSEEILEEIERPEVFGIPAYEPRSERGRLYAEKAVWPFEKVHESAKWWGDQVLGATGSPELAATVSSVVEGATLFAGPSLLKRLPGISKSNVLKLRRKLGKAKRTGDFTDPELKVAIEDVMAEAKKDPAMMADIQRTVDEMSAGVMKDPTTAALDKIRAERAAEVKPVEPELKPAEERILETLLKVEPEEPRPTVPRVEPVVEPTRAYRGEKAPREAHAFKLADELGLEFEAYTKPEPDIAGGGYMFSITEKADPMFKGTETSISVEKLSKLPTAVKAKIKWWKETLAAREVPAVVPEVPKRRKAAPPKPTPESQAAKFELEYKGSREEPTGIVHEYFDPQTGEHFVADSVEVVGKELEMHRKLVEERTTKYSDLTVADYAKLVDDWTAGRGDLDINVIKKELQDFIAEKPARDFATTADRTEFISGGEELLGKINKRMKERGLVGVRKVGGGSPPEVGLVCVELGKDGKIYYGKKGQMHVEVVDDYNLLGKVDEEGFAGPDGEFLTREEALTRLSPEEKVAYDEAAGELGIETGEAEAMTVNAVLNDGNISKPKLLSGKERINYIREIAEKRGKTDRQQIEALIEEGVDISDRLPPEARDAYRVYKDMQEMATVSSEPRGVADIYRDLTEIFNERGEWTPKGRHLTHEQKMALQRLEADAKRLVGDLSEYLRSLGLDEKQILMAKKRLDEIRKIEPETSVEPRSTWIDAEAVSGGDKIVKQRKISRDRQAIPLYDSVVKMLQGANELKKSWFKFLDVPIRDFREAGLEPIHEAYRSVVHAAHEEAKVMRADVKELRRGVGWKSGKRIGAYAVGQQKRGRGILKKMGVKVPELTKFEMRKYSELRDRFETFFDRIQSMRAMIGKKPLEKVDNYFTFMRTFNVMDRLGIKSNVLMDDPKVVAERYVKYGATKFRWGVHRVKAGAIPVELDPFRIYQNYAADAIHHLHLSPLIATVNELLGRLPDPTTGKMTWELKNHKPILYKSITGWNNYIAGKTPLDLGWVDKGINKLRRNLLYSILGGSVRSGLIQFTALKNTLVELGFTPTLKGITASIEDAVKFDGKNRKFALKNSKHLSVRSPELELAMNDVMRSIRGGKLGEMQEVVGGASLKFLTLMDMETAIMTWNAAHRFAKGKGYSRKAAFNFADDVCTRTQASALPGDIAPIQRSALGGAFTTFQTFVINDWGFLTRDVLGIRSAKITNDVMLKKVVRMLIATTAFNILLEDVIGVHSPLPTPVRDLLESMKDKDKPIDTMLKVALGLTDQVPGMGGARYGKGIAGAPLETVNDFLAALQEKPLAPPLWEPTGKLVGVPFTGQAAKMMKAKKRGESPWGQLVGTYTPKPKGRESGLGGLGGLGGL